MLITPEPHGIFRSNFAYLYILIVMQNGDLGLPSISLVGHVLVKMLITVEPHGIFLSNFAYL